VPAGGAGDAAGSERAAGVRATDVTAARWRGSRQGPSQAQGGVGAKSFGQAFSKACGSRAAPWSASAEAETPRRRTLDKGRENIYIRLRKGEKLSTFTA